MSETSLLNAVRGWQPDRACIDQGDDYCRLAVRCWASAGLSDAQIEHRVRALVPEDESSIERHDAAYAIAAHCAFARVEPRQIIELLVQLADDVPDWWPADPEDIAELVLAVVQMEARP